MDDDEAESGEEEEEEEEQDVEADGADCEDADGDAAGDAAVRPGDKDAALRAEIDALAAAAKAGEAFARELPLTPKPTAASGRAGVEIVSSPIRRHRPTKRRSSTRIDPNSVEIPRIWARLKRP